ncbi:HAT (Half-A-TPR) repeat [Fragilaria crotonensis]|nr:HAT (Half-A-TPR) repeat [Fragilaria crotonensis]
MSFRPKTQAPKGYVGPGSWCRWIYHSLRHWSCSHWTGSGRERWKPSGEARRAVNAANNFGQAPRGMLQGRTWCRSRRRQWGGTDDGPSGGGYDPFEGYQQPPSTAPSPYDQDDEQADQIYAEVEERMRARRKKRKSADEQQPEEGMTETQKLKSQFRELKEKLADVTDAQWASIPDVGDYSLKHKQKRREDTFTPLSDSLLESRVQANRDTTAGNKATAATAVADGFTSVANMSGLAQARGRSLSVRDTNPKHGPGWIASARVEEAAGKILQARKLIQEGCETCPTNEDVWLEAARLHPPNVAKIILATAVRRIPTSTKVFLRAADLETHDTNKKAVLRKALEANPPVEKVPDSVEMWLALARLESYENARRVLNQARKALPGTALFGSQRPSSRNRKIMLMSWTRLSIRLSSRFQKHDAVVTRAQWLEEAEHAEHAQAPLTSAALVRCTVGIGVDPEDRLRTWADDAKDALSRGSVATARAIIAHALASFPTKRNLWMQAVDMERKHGSPETLDEVLAEASKRLPKVELFGCFALRSGGWLAKLIRRVRF